VNEDSVAYQALHLAKQNVRDMESHETICAERYAGIHKGIDEIKGVLWKAGAGAFGIIMAMLAFLVTQQLNTNQKLHDDNQNMVARMQQQLAEDRASRTAGGSR